jgi:hypothetical protein
MEPKTLRVRARGDSLVQNYERLDLGVNAFIGRVFKETSPGRHGFAPTNEVVEVPYRAEYVKALREGDLEAADEATALAAGLTFAGDIATSDTDPAPADGDKQ